LQENKLVQNTIEKRKTRGADEKVPQIARRYDE
jgi:hypothetical protein